VTETRLRSLSELPTSWQEERKNAKRRNAEARARKAERKPGRLAAAAYVTRLPEPAPLMSGCGIKVVGVCSDAADSVKARYGL
jgi:hypothetical protein